VREFLRELFRVELYKPNQGRILRQATAAGVAILLLVGVYGLFQQLRIGLRTWPGSWIDWFNGWLAWFGLWTIGRNPSVELWIRELFRYGFPLSLALLSIWIAYRLVNVPRFADFLVAVEAEMYKVSWPSRLDVYRNSIVVLIAIFGLSAVLYVFDFFWNVLFRWLHVL